MSDERIDLDAIESEWDNYQSDGPIDDYLASLNISRMIAELKRCYEEIDNLLKQERRLIDIAERCGAWDGGIDISDINEEYGACQCCGSIPSGCCEEASE